MASVRAAPTAEADFKRFRVTSMWTKPPPNPLPWFALGDLDPAQRFSNGVDDAEDAELIP